MARASSSRVMMASRAAAAGAAAVLALLAGAYYFTYEPAFEVTIRWDDGVSWDRRLALERRFGLVRARNQARWTITYDLVDTRTANIRALVQQPEIDDRGVLDTITYSVPPDAPYGQGWMWVGSRWPIVRINRLVPLIVFAACAVILFSIRQELRARRLGTLRLVACLGRLAGPRLQDAGERLPDQRGIGP